MTRDELIEKTADALLTTLTRIGALQTATVIRANGRPVPFTWDRLAALAAIEGAISAIAPMIRAQERERIALALPPVTSYQAGDSDWTIGFYNCHTQFMKAICAMGDDP